MHSKNALGGKPTKSQLRGCIRGVYLKGSGFTPFCLKVVEGGGTEQPDSKILCLIQLINFNVT